MLDFSYLFSVACFFGQSCSSVGDRRFWKSAVETAVGTTLSFGICCLFFWPGEYVWFALASYLSHICYGSVNTGKLELKSNIVAQNSSIREWNISQSPTEYSIPANNCAMVGASYDTHLPKWCETLMQVYCLIPSIFSTCCLYLPNFAHAKIKAKWGEKRTCAGKNMIFHSIFH